MQTRVDTMGRISRGIAAAGIAAAGIAGCASQPGLPPFIPVTTVGQLMESVVVHAAEVYWAAVSIIVDENGVTENYPQNDEEWEEVWSAALAIAESGNLLMMAPRAVDDGEWMQVSAAMVRAGVEAAAAAEAKDPDRVLDAGERVYNVCLACHVRYIAE
jgi:hypothetical protein